MKTASYETSLTNPLTDKEVTQKFEIQESENLAEFLASEFDGNEDEATEFVNDRKRSSLLSAGKAQYWNGFAKRVKAGETVLQAEVDAALASIVNFMATGKLNAGRNTSKQKLLSLKEQAQQQIAAKGSLSSEDLAALFAGLGI